MFSQKQNSQNNTESEASNARLNYGAEKEKQIMNQIRTANMQRQQSSSFFQSSIGGGLFEIAFKKN